jgi:hypothetical protein
MAFIEIMARLFGIHGPVRQEVPAPVSAMKPLTDLQRRLLAVSIDRTTRLEPISDSEARDW